MHSLRWSERALLLIVGGCMCFKFFPEIFLEMSLLRWHKKGKRKIIRRIVLP